MDPDSMHDVACRILREDGAKGVALILADHHRLLRTLAAIYNEAAPAGAGAAEERLATIRENAHGGLRLPHDLRVKLGGTGTPRRGEDEDEPHRHSWQGPHFISPFDVDAGPLAIERCDCGAYRIGHDVQEDTGGVIFIPESEASLLEAITDEFAKDRVGAAERRARSAEDRAERAEEARDEARESERRLADALDVADTRAEALESAGATLVHHLGGHDGIGPAAWWVEAAAALGELERLAVEKDGA